MRYLSMFTSVWVLTACSHELEVKNLQMYATTMHLGTTEPKPFVAVLPFNGTPDEVFYHNALVERLAQDPSIERLQTDYAPHASGSGAAPDLILSIDPTTTYRSSGWNFLINWPGFLIFTPAWNGYVYYADIITKVDVNDRDGKVLSGSTTPISYSIRQAEMDRTIFTGLTWLEVSLLALGGGIYNANTFDRDIIGRIEVHVKDNYTNYVYGKLAPQIAIAAGQVMAAPAVPPPPAPDAASPPADPPATPPSHP